MTLHPVHAYSEEEAIGFATKRLPELKPDFSIDTILVTGPFRDFKEDV